MFIVSDIFLNFNDCFVPQTFILDLFKIMKCTVQKVNINKYLSKKSVRIC